MTDDSTVEQLMFDEEFGCSIVSEPLSRNIDIILSDLQTARGAAFVSLLKEIANHPAFSALKTDPCIYAIGGERGEDYDNLLNAARKAVEHGYRVFILPNPKGFRTADFVFERKGIYKMFDLKTIQGKASVSNRLKESIGQTKSVLLHIVCDYNVRNLSIEIRRYFEMYSEASEVLIFVGRKMISIKRNTATSIGFLKMLMNSFRK